MSESETGEIPPFDTTKWQQGLVVTADVLRGFVEIAKGYRVQLLGTWSKETADGLSADLLHALVHKFLDTHGSD